LVSNIASKGVPLPEACAVIAIAAELGLGLLLLLGWQTRWVALGLALFVIVITPIFHGYWAVPSAQVMAQSQNFFKNTAIVGGLLVFAAFGAGGWSWDAMRRRGDDLVAAAKPRAQQ
jgi:putative oxidoreductase